MVNEHIPTKQPGLHQGDKGQISFHVRVFSKNIKGKPYLIQIAKPMEDLDEEASELFVAIGIGLAVSTVILIGLSYVLAGRIVKPIAVINRLAREINENTLQKRIPLSHSHDEIYELATRLNQMFDRLQFSFARQKQFLADASHELKSPIAMLRLFFDEAIQNRNLPSTLQHQLEAQGHNVLRMDRLVKTLLELSILEIKASLKPEPFDITDLGHSVLADFLPLMEISKIRMETEMPLQLEIHGDRDKLRRLFINIFDNAIKYNVEGGQIRLSISENSDSIHLSLYNTGPGISKEDLQKVFDQFYRVEKSRSVKYGGAGLGLSIVKEIVRLHAGTVFIESEPGRWTQVNIILPQPRKNIHSE